MLNLIRFVVIVASSIGTLDSSIYAQSIYENRKLGASDGAAGKEFGSSLASDQSVVVVGAPGDDVNGAGAGAAYLLDATSGEQIAKLLPISGLTGANFGAAVAISNGVVAVGAPGDEHLGVRSGAAYLFDVSTGTQLRKITPNDPASDDEFGCSIAIDNGLVAVGAMRDDDLGSASGAAYLFDAQTGDQLQKLLPNAGAANQNFGVSIAIDGGVVAIGARTYFVLGEGFTFAKVYLFDASSGNQINKLQADIENYNGDQGGHFGDSICMGNGLVAVGAPNRSIFFDFSGAAYVFNASTGEQLQFIFPADGHDRDNFGNSVAIDDGTLAIGARHDDDSGSKSGSAYLYEAASGALISKLAASDGASSDLFGTSTTFSNGSIFVGAIGDDDNGANSGSLYVFDTFGVIPGDVNRDGVVDINDIMPFVAIAVGEDANLDDLAVSDLNADGVCNGADIQAFIDILIPS